MELVIGIAILMASLAGIVTSIALLWTKVVKPTYKFFHRVSDLVEVMHDLPEWCESVDSALSELRPNGGGSIKDKVTNIQHLIGQHTEDPRCHADQHRPPEK